MRVITVPCRRDNFSFLVGADGSAEVAVVDPCDTEPVLNAAREHGLRITAILNTHHHGDHVGGNRGVLEAFPRIPVYAHSSDAHRIPGITQTLDEGDEIDVAGLHYHILFIPGHTTGHIAYVTEGAVFAGDTLFGGGCGRLFEGTPKMMHQSINVKLAALPDTTRVYFAHEYTAANLRFAQTVDPNNEALRQRIADVAKARSDGEWTTPSTIGLERATNPFMRVTQPELVASVRLDGDSTPETVFAALRRAKDSF